VAEDTRKTYIMRKSIKPKDIYWQIFHESVKRIYFFQFGPFFSPPAKHLQMPLKNLKAICNFVYVVCTVVKLMVCC